MTWAFIKVPAGLWVYKPKMNFFSKYSVKKLGQSTLGQDWEELESKMYYMAIYRVNEGEKLNVFKTSNTVLVKWKETL